MKQSCLALLALACLGCVTQTLAAAPPTYNDDCIVPGVNLGSQSVFPSIHQLTSASVSTSGAVTQVQVAKSFNVTYYPTFKVVTNLFWFQESYILYPCGLGKPDVSAYPELANVKKFFQVPLRAVAVKDTTALEFLKDLGVQDRVKYGPLEAVDPCMQQLVRPNTTGGCGAVYNSKGMTDLADYGEMQFARIIGYANSISDPYAIPFFGSADPGALNRAEYIKFLAPFFNKEKVANQLFTQTFNNYQRLRGMVSAANIASKPVVAWITYQQAYAGCCAEQIKFYNNAYRRDYLVDAGGSMLDVKAIKDRLAVGQYANSFEIDFSGNLVMYNLTLTLPLMHDIMKGVTAVVDETIYADANGDGKNPPDITLNDFMTRFGFTTADLSNADYPFLVSGNVLRTDGRSTARVANPAIPNQDIGGDTDWFEGALAHPDVVLEDLILAFNPSVLANANAEPDYIKPLGRATNSPRVTLVSQGACPEKTCILTPRAICPPVYMDCDGSLAVTTVETAPCRPTCPLKSSAAARSPVAPALMALLALLAAFLLTATL